MSAISWRQQSQSDIKIPHPDYEVNLSKTRKLVEQIKDKIPTHMYYKMEDVQAQKRCLFIVGFRAPCGSKTHSVAVPVFLHQPAGDFERTLYNSYGSIHKFAKEWNEKNPQQLELITTSGIAKINDLKAIRERLEDRNVGW